jgi:hypothetical protein
MSKPKNTPAKRHQDHDIFVRGFLSIPILVEKLLRYALDANILPYVDFTTLRPFTDVHIDKRLRITHSDSIHEANLRQDNLPLQYRHMLNAPLFRFVFIWEAKSKKQKLPIDFQVGGYDDNIRRRDFKNSDLDKDPLSIVVPIVLYHGVEKWDKKRAYEYYKPYLPDVLMAFIPQHRFIVIDIQALSEEDIENAIGLGELRAAFIALKHGHEPNFFKRNMKKVLNFVQEIPVKELLDMYLEMLYEYMQRRSGMDNEEFNETVEQSNSKEMVAEFKTIFQTAREEGREEGIAIGEAKAAELMRKSIQLLVRTTQMTDKEIASELGITEDFVKKLRQESVNGSHNGHGKKSK